MPAKAGIQKKADVMSEDKKSKYAAKILIPVFRKAAEFRNEMIAAGFTDNGGAIHSAERMLDILGQRLKYPNLNHLNDIRKYPNAEFSDAAWQAHNRKEKVFIEHVSPMRAFTRATIEKVTKGVTDKALKDFIKKKYRLVLLTADETKRLNKKNRTKMHHNRLAGIKIKARNKK